MSWHVRSTFNEDVIFQTLYLTLGRVTKVSEGLHWPWKQMTQAIQYSYLDKHKPR